MPIEIPGFSNLVNEFNQRMVEEATIKGELDRTREMALVAWEEMEKNRQFALEDLLKERGLGICSWGLEHKDRRVAQEKLGIFPRETLSLLYVNGLDNDSKPKLYTCCPVHYQTDLDIHRSSVESHRTRWFMSGVEKRGDRLVTVTDSIDITDVPLNREGHSAEMEAIYGYFNLPPLPPRPVFR